MKQFIVLLLLGLLTLGASTVQAKITAKVPQISSPPQQTNTLVISQPLNSDAATNLVTADLPIVVPLNNEKGYLFNVSMQATNENPVFMLTEKGLKNIGRQGDEKALFAEKGNITNQTEMFAAGESPQQTLTVATTNNSLPKKMRALDATGHSPGSATKIATTAT